MAIKIRCRRKRESFCEQQKIEIARRCEGQDSVNRRDGHLARVKTRRNARKRTWQKFTWSKVEGPGGSITEIGNETKRG